MGLRRRLVLLSAIMAATFGWAGIAHAGYAIQPADGSTTDSQQPTFLVYLDSLDSLPEVYVAATPDMSSLGVPAQELGSCVPSTPTAEADKFTCRPSSYASTSTSSLAAGTYYWWMTFLRTDPGQVSPSVHISGPFRFTVPEPVAPTDASLVSPADGATVSAAPKLTINAPAGAGVRIYVSAGSARTADGSPAGKTAAGCTGTTTSAGETWCQVEAGDLVAGSTYYWWAIVTIDGSSWTYGPRSFTVAPPKTGGGGGAHGISYAPYLPSSDHFSGSSVKQTRLSKAAYAMSKVVGVPKSIAVACWSTTDWDSMTGDNHESFYSTLGFFYSGMPHWVNLSPRICRTFETLIYHRPAYTNVRTADALDTLTHEMIHALGIRNEAETECFAMQLSFITGWKMGLPLAYAENLDRLSLRNYPEHPPSYVNTARCREGGAWDLYPKSPSLPWHLPAV